MSDPNLRCRQCGWALRLEPGRIPRYGARVRCPQCDTLMDVAPHEPAAAVAGRTGAPAASPRGAPAAGPRGAPAAASLGVAVGEGLSAAGADRTDTPQEPAIGAGAAPSARAVSTPSGAPEPEIGDDRARDVLRTWLREIHDAGSSPPAAETIFVLYEQELTHLYALWRAARGGKPTVEQFREALLDALSAHRRGDASARP